MSLINREFNNLKKDLVPGSCYQNLNVLAKYCRIKEKSGVSYPCYKLTCFLDKFKKYELYEYFLIYDKAIKISDTRADWIKEVKKIIFCEGYLNVNKKH